VFGGVFVVTWLYSFLVLCLVDAGFWFLTGCYGGWLCSKLLAYWLMASNVR